MFLTLYSFKLRVSYPLLDLKLTQTGLFSRIYLCRKKPVKTSFLPDSWQQEKPPLAN